MIRSDAFRRTRRRALSTCGFKRRPPLSLKFKRKKAEMLMSNGTANHRKASCTLRTIMLRAQIGHVLSLEGHRVTRRIFFFPEYILAFLCFELFQQSSSLMLRWFREGHGRRTKFYCWATLDAFGSTIGYLFLISRSLLGSTLPCGGPPGFIVYG